MRCMVSVKCKCGYRMRMPAGYLMCYGKVMETTTRRHCSLVWGNKRMICPFVCEGIEYGTVEFDGREGGGGDQSLY